MAMKVAQGNGAKVYNLASGKTMPQWLSEAKKRALAKDDDFRRRVELIQDFEMTTASQTIKMTPDGEHIIVAGTYPPVVRCYTVSDMAMKFQRGLSCEVVTFETLSEDFGKLVFLQTDRTLNFHAPYGTHYSVRVPKFGRDLIYGWSNCDLYVAGSGEEVYRLNLEQGTFKEPFTLGFTGCNKLHINPVHNLLACGGETAACEFWDPRSRKAVAKLQVDQNANVEVTALKFDTDGLTLAVGTSNGNCMLYDIRSRTPLYVKEHQYGLPVIDVTFHNASKHVISTDKKVVKIWERHEPHMGRILTNIETPCDINGIQCVSDRRGQSGMLMLAGEQSRMMVYFVPQLGPAPRWCSFLEGLTEELEETSGQSIYEDYKFVTKAEVEEMGAAGLIGTPMLRGYMHGFFMEMKLYNKLRAVSKPFEYEEHRKKKIQAKIDEKRQSRIIAQKRLPKINKDLAEKFMKTAHLAKGVEEGGGEGGGRGGAGGLIDSRFAALFEREEFQRDETSEDYKLRNPNKGNNQGKGKRGGGDDSDDELEQIYQPVQGVDDDDDDYDDGEDYADKGGSDEARYASDDSDIEHVRADFAEQKKLNKKRKARGGEEDEEGEIGRATRRVIERAKTTSVLERRASKMGQQRGKDSSSSASQSWGGGKGVSSQGASSSSGAARAGGRGGPRMYEIADGVSSAKAVFSHTDESRQKRAADRVIGTVPLMHRLETGSVRKERKDEDGGLGLVRYLRTEGEGLVRAMSYVPKEGTFTAKGEDKLGKAEKEAKAEGKGGRAKGGKGRAKGGGKGGGKGKGRLDEREAFSTLSNGGR